MAKLDTLISVWDEAHRELLISIDGTPDADLWTRPHPALLSVGEQVGHVAYWEARNLIIRDPQGKLVGAESPLIDDRFQYYTTQVGQPYSLDTTTAELKREFERVHAIARTGVLDIDPAPGDPLPWRDGWNWGYQLQYTGFHAAYHAGQIYSVRHILGHVTEDN